MIVYPAMLMEDVYPTEDGESLETALISVREGCVSIDPLSGGDERPGLSLSTEEALMLARFIMEHVGGADEVDKVDGGSIVENVHLHLRSPKEDV